MFEASKSIRSLCRNHHFLEGKLIGQVNCLIEGSCDLQKGSRTDQGQVIVQDHIPKVRVSNFTSSSNILPS